MNRRRALAITAAMLLALPAAQSAFAQQTEAPAAPPHSMPTVDDHLRMLTEKLDLTADQQEKARPIITEMQNEMQKTHEDKSLTQDEVIARTHLAFTKADKQFREFLSDDQKKKLDELEEEMHPGQSKDHDSSPHN
jgi:Spy/CpxP family protein refolding chaperone